jgi:hypothetical protein
VGDFSGPAGEATGSLAGMERNGWRWARREQRWYTSPERDPESPHIRRLSINIRCSFLSFDFTIVGSSGVPTEYQTEGLIGGSWFVA